MSSSNQAALLDKQQLFLSGASVTHQNDYIETVCLSNDLGQHYDGVTPTYSQIKTAIYNGRIPGMKLRNGKLVVPRAKRDDIAAFFGMTPKASA